MSKFSQSVGRKLNSSPTARWTVLAVVSFTMFCGYYISDVMSPLMDALQQQYEWTAAEYGIFTGTYAFFNVFLFLLIWGGIMLDKFGSRLIGFVACLMMIVGCAVKYYAVASPDTFSNQEFFKGTWIQMKPQVFWACVGYSIFGVGIEIAGMTVTKIIARWFKGFEIALAMGVQVSVARIGTTIAIASALPMSVYFGSLSMPILVGLIGLIIGLLSFFVFIAMDIRLDRSIDKTELEKEDEFKMSDIYNIISNKGFWLIALLCVLFYSAIFPFLKYATSLMINKYNLTPELAGIIPSLLPIGAIFLTPIFGGIYDKKGKGVSIMIIGASMLVIVHLLFASPIFNVWWFATFLMLLLGVAFSLVPSALWPAVPKIIPQNQLGTAYGLVFWVQNIGLMLVPMLIGGVLNKYCIVETDANGANLYNFTWPMLIFAGFGILAVFVGFILKYVDKKENYGLQKPNITKENADETVVDLLT